MWSFAGNPLPRFAIPKKILASDRRGHDGPLARWHMFEEKREAVMAIEAAVLPLMSKAELTTNVSGLHG